MDFNSPHVVLEETNPYNSIQAVVEDDGRALYLYVVPIKNPNAMVAVWVANRAIAPAARDVKAMQMGFAPMMEAKNCRGGSAPPSIDTKGPPTHPGIAVYATIGMGAQAMPGVEIVTDKPEDFRRVELVVARKKEEDWAPQVLTSIFTINKALAPTLFRSQFCLSMQPARHIYPAGQRLFRPIGHPGRAAPPS